MTVTVEYRPENKRLWLGFPLTDGLFLGWTVDLQYYWLAGLGSRTVT